MCRVLMLPLDERPCNYNYPNLITEKCDDVQLILPPKNLLGQKKHPAALPVLDQWLQENFAACDYAVISLDMLVYGGIVPSRLHHQTAKKCLERLKILQSLHQKCPQVKIFAFSLIMRAPSYNSADEEPDYYSEYGTLIFRLGALRDKSQCGVASAEEKSEALRLEQSLPSPVISDFCNRRNTNHAVNLHAISLVKNGVLDFLVIPLDDCAPFGWAACERRQLSDMIRNNALSNRVFSYSGADEVGCILLARAVNQSRVIIPSVQICYSSAYGRFVIPRFEDRMLDQNLTWQVTAAGGRVSICPEDSDYILLVNAPTEAATCMADANHPANLLNTSGRCLPNLVSNFRVLSAKKPVIMADLAISNGADREWMELLQQEDLLGQLYAYGGWNTAANAAGCSIAQGMIGGKDPAKTSLFTSHRILEDWLYMSILRQSVADYARRNNLSFENAEQEKQLEEYVTQQMRQLAKDLSLPANIVIDRVFFPWHRLFEIDLCIHSCEQT